MTEEKTNKRGGKRHGSGRKLGSPNKRTIERGIRLRLEEEARQKLLEVGTDNATEVQVRTQGKKLAKDVLRDLMELSVGMAAMYQLAPPGMAENVNADEDKFLQWFGLAGDMAKNLAPYESPRYSAVMVGAAVVTKVTVEGGMPDEFAAPPKEIEGELVPGSTYSVEDDRVTKAA